jgi:hypothetical protein
MGLIVEFTDPTVTREEIDAYIEDGRIPFVPGRHVVQRQANGNVAIYIGGASFPGLARKKLRLPDELQVLYTFRADIFDGYQPPEGMYAYGEDIQMMSAQRVKDVQLGQLKTVVEIVSPSIERIEQAFSHLRSGKLKPIEDWSSSGTIEAPADEKKEPSGSHPVPQTAAATQAA